MADQVKLFVGGLPSSFGEEELRQLFSPHGVVREAVMLASKSTSGQRCGFVWFQTRTAQEMAAAAIATLSDRHCPPGVDKPIQVSVAKNSAAAGRACGRDTSLHAAAAFPNGGLLLVLLPVTLPGFFFVSKLFREAVAEGAGASEVACVARIRGRHWELLLLSSSLGGSLVLDVVHVVRLAQRETTLHRLHNLGDTRVSAGMHHEVALFQPRER